MNTPGTRQRNGQGLAAGRPNNVVSLNELKLTRARRLYRSGMDGYTETLRPSKPWWRTFKASWAPAGLC